MVGRSSGVVGARSVRRVGVRGDRPRGRVVPACSALYLESNTYAFTIMSATVLGGIALGSFFATPLLARRVNHIRVLAVVEFGVAIAAAVSSLLFLSQAYGVRRPVGDLVTRDRRRSRVRCDRERVGDPADHVLMGLAFPFGVRVYVGDDPDPGAGSVRSTGSTSQPGSPDRSSPGSCSCPCSDPSQPDRAGARVGVAAVRARVRGVGRTTRQLDGRRGRRPSWSQRSCSGRRCRSVLLAVSRYGIPTSGCCGSRRVRRRR